MPIGYRVELTAAAERDVDEIVQYIAEHDLPERTMRVLDAIEAAVNGLATEPHRGSYLKGLAAVGIRGFREVYFKLYRIIDRVFEAEPSGQAGFEPVRSICRRPALCQRNWRTGWTPARGHDPFWSIARCHALNDGQPGGCIDRAS